MVEIVFYGDVVVPISTLNFGIVSQASQTLLKHLIRMTTQIELVTPHIELDCISTNIVTYVVYSILTNVMYVLCSNMK